MITSCVHKRSGVSFALMASYLPDRWHSLYCGNHSRFIVEANMSVGEKVSDIHSFACTSVPRRKLVRALNANDTTVIDVLELEAEKMAEGAHPSQVRSLDM